MGINQDSKHVNKIGDTQYDCIAVGELYFFRIDNPHGNYTYCLANHNTISIAIGDLNQLEASAPIFKGKTL